MKTLTYLLAAVGLLFLGAALNEWLGDPNRGLVSAEPVLASAVYDHPRAAVADVSKDLRVHNVASTPAGVSDNGAVFYPARPDTGHVYGLPQVFVALFGAAVVLIVVLGSIAVLFRLTRPRMAAVPDESSAVQALHQMGCRMEARLESLETLLLERGPRGH
jgi:hypothetical protein